MASTAWPLIPCKITLVNYVHSPNLNSVPRPCYALSPPGHHAPRGENGVSGEGSVGSPKG
eukprot:624683-Pleurochrysis_carterae.AAC.1